MGQQPRQRKFAYAHSLTFKQAVLFYASDDTRINQQIEGLVQAIGFEPFRLGGIDQSIRIETFGDLAEYGGLGKTVTLAEARLKL